MEPLITVENLTKQYVKEGEAFPILKGVSFTVEKGEFVSITGASGSGKSTLLQILGLLDTPSSGTYCLAGHNVSHLDEDTLAKARSKFTGFVFQNFYLIPYADALENVMLPGMYTNIPMAQLRERALYLLEKVGLIDRIHFTPNKLSGGQQQRVALARALFNNPVVLFADEPTGQLDSKISREILELFTKVNDEGTTVIVVTHDKATAEIAKRTIAVQDGVIVKDAVLRT